MKDKKFLVLSALFFLLFGVAMVALSVSPTKIFQARASVPSASKSFIIAHYPSGGTVPVNAKIKISVYIRDEDGGVLANRSVRLGNSLAGVNVLPSDSMSTDANGIAEYTMSSDNPGKTQVTAVDQASSITLGNSPIVQFAQ